MQRIAFSGFHLYGLTLVIEILVLSIMYLLNQVIDVTTSAFVLFFCPIIITAWYGGLKAAIFATLLTGLAIVYFFLPPLNSLLLGGEEFIQASLFLIQSFLFITPVTLLQSKISLKPKVEIPQDQKLCLEYITKLEETKAALWQSQSWLDRIVENSYSAIYIKDLEGRYLLFNHKCETIFNISRGQVLGKTDYDFLPDEIAATYRYNEQKVIELGKALEFEEFGIFNSQSVTFISLKCPLYNCDGVLYGICGISTEISEQQAALRDRKNMEEALIKQSEELAQINRIKDDFLTTVSHELRTPLNAILGWSQVLRSGKLSDSIVAKALETIERNARSQKQLIEDILDVSEIITGKLHLQISLIDVVPIIETVINICLPSVVAKQIQFKFVHDEVKEKILGDSDRLQQVIWNLLSNAIKFTPAGGNIAINLRVEEWQKTTEEQKVACASSYLKFVVIEVTDTGIGIKPEFLPFVFDRFRQADGSTTRLYGGLGLGLAIVRHIVELHGGVIYVQSEGEGKGATFTVKLPLVNNL
ncbi:PAS domain-containing protein [Phormidium sp. LEGE 05292]|uniref:PAS domain-containing sensor histidine kinase n=1 Tax=[Phormidium] sp. LEGE 05292 TaxID=767427 RepID=UPI00187F1230|nr:ATP-binding protein [Phormidium sp. LEGE 05292]MBE9225017.1 PAS domain-containing protein [Phormidium sp. LEGE 05292]